MVQRWSIAWCVRVPWIGRDSGASSEFTTWLSDRHNKVLLMPQPYRVQHFVMKLSREQIKIPSIDFFITMKKYWWNWSLIYRSSFRMGKEHQAVPENLPSKGRRLSCPIAPGLPPRPGIAPEEVDRSRPRRKSSPAVVLAPTLSRLSPEFAKRCHTSRCKICSEKISVESTSSLTSVAYDNRNKCSDRLVKGGRPRRGSTPNIYLGDRRPPSPHPSVAGKGCKLSRQISTSLDYLEREDEAGELKTSSRDQSRRECGDRPAKGCRSRRASTPNIYLAGRRPPSPHPLTARKGCMLSRQVSISLDDLSHYDENDAKPWHHRSRISRPHFSRKPTYKQLWATTGVHALPPGVEQRLKTKPPGMSSCLVNGDHRRRGSYDLTGRTHRVTFASFPHICAPGAKKRTSRRRSRSESAPRPRSVPANPGGLSNRLSSEAQTAVLGAYTDEIVSEFAKTDDTISGSLERIDVDDDMVINLPEGVKICKIEEGMNILDSVKKHRKEGSYRDLLQQTVKEFEQWRASFCK